MELERRVRDIAWMSGARTKNAREKPEKGDSYAKTNRNPITIAFLHLFKTAERIRSLHCSQIVPGSLNITGKAREGGQTKHTGIRQTRRNIEGM